MMMGRRRQVKFLLLLCMSPFIVMIIWHIKTQAVQVGVTREQSYHAQDSARIDAHFVPLRKKLNRTNHWGQRHHMVTMAGGTKSSANNDIVVQSPVAENPSEYNPEKLSVSANGSDREEPNEESPGHGDRQGASEHRKSRFGFRGEDVVVWRTLENGTKVREDEYDQATYLRDHELSKTYNRYLSKFKNLSRVGVGKRKAAIGTLHRLQDKHLSPKTKLAEWKAFDDSLRHRAATRAIKWDQEWLENFAGKEMIDLMDLTIVGKGVIPVRLKEFELKLSMAGKSLEDLRSKIRKELLRLHSMQPTNPISYDRKHIPIELYNLAPYLFDKIPHSFSSTTKSPCWENSAMSFRVLCLPYFYLIGAPKSATTDLWSKILFHPDVLKALDKEPQFWTRGNLIRGLLKYCSNFMPLSNAITESEHSLKSAISGDGTASNFWERRRSQMLYGQRPDGPPYFTADVIRAIQPGARIIIILREPTSRLYSEYLDLDAFWPLFKSPEDFHVRVEDVIGHFNRCLETRHVAGCASNYYQPRIQVGMYSIHIREWMKRFPREQIIILTTDEWSIQPSVELKKVYKFLNLTEIPVDAIESFTARGRQNQRKPRNRWVGEMLPETRNLLSSFYQPFNEDLARLLEDDKYLWPRGQT